MCDSANCWYPSFLTKPDDDINYKQGSIMINDVITSEFTEGFYSIILKDMMALVPVSRTIHDMSHDLFQLDQQSDGPI